ncbi:uncharacterized protein LOC115630560 [Scaptodrosophila lebanonensis]|uniref:Uncharacterized protein LOC115630560 n=1 Tax=Drosophila lebanonensis TaxID=7225 RepID=A0A6J2U3P9_DROLE|nr:uncharacterized protein LOC115630560 [Scaptodrosophila lebanonensis]
MDAARTYERYVKALGFADQQALGQSRSVNRQSLTTQPYKSNPLNKLPNIRLPAGKRSCSCSQGRISYCNQVKSRDSCVSFVQTSTEEMSMSSNCQNSSGTPKNSESQRSVRGAKVRQPPKQKQEKKQSKTQCQCIYKRPVITVPSEMPKSGGNEKKSTASPNAARKRNEPEPRKQALRIGQPNKEQSNAQKPAETKNRQSIGSQAQPTNQCDNCSLIPKISRQLCELQKKLEGQDQQSQQLREVSEQVKQLQCVIEKLKEQFNNLENRELKADCCQGPCGMIPNEKPKPMPKKVEQKKSSTCQFCRDKQLILQNSNLHCEVLKLIGKRHFCEIVLTMLLRADNLYHINVRELKTGCVLGCVLVSDAAIEEAIKLDLFKEILTFCVIDKRNTLKPRDCAFGINFELVCNERQCGGQEEDEVMKTARLYGEECATTILGMSIENIRMLSPLTEENSTNFISVETISMWKPNLSISQVVLSDKDDRYPDCRFYYKSVSDSDLSSEGNASSFNEDTLASNRKKSALEHTRKLKMRSKKANHWRNSPTIGLKVRHPGKRN